MNVIDVTVVNRWWLLINRYIKKVEGKKDSPTWSKVKVRDILNFINQDFPESTVQRTVVEIVKYTIDDLPLIRPEGDEELANALIAEYLACEGMDNALPGVATIDEGVRVYREFWKDPKEIIEYGVLALRLG